MNDAEHMELAARLARLRTRRVPDAREPKLSDVRLVGDEKRARRFRLLASAPGCAPALEEMRGNFRRHQKIVAHAGPAWAQVVPRDLAGVAVVVGVKGGVVLVSVPSVAVKFRIDRTLRAGGENDFMRRMPPGTRGVRVVLGERPELMPDYPQRTRTVEEATREQHEEDDFEAGLSGPDVGARG